MDKNWMTVAKYAAIGSTISATLAGLVIGGYSLGTFLDGKFGVYPIWTLILILVGVGLGVAYLIVIIGKLAKSKDEP